MKNTMDMQDRLNALNAAHTKAFCIRLWLELTIVGRGIWADGAGDAASQLNQFKWLNEIQHRVWGAHADSRDGALAHLLERIASHCAQAPGLEREVGAALHRALDHASRV